MAERSRAYVSDAFAHIPPWCNGSTRVFGTQSAELITPWSLVQAQHEALGYRRQRHRLFSRSMGNGDGAMDGIAAFSPFSLG